MWDFDHPPAAAALAERYQIDWMLPSECADHLAEGIADIGLVPIAALPRNPSLRVLPGCTIASKDYVRSLALIRRAHQTLQSIRTVAADTASRTTVTYSRLLFRMWGNSSVRFIPMAADLDAMLKQADAAIVIGDPALLALEERWNRAEREPEELAYHDIAHEWRTLTGLPFISAVWAARAEVPIEQISPDFLASRDHGIANMDVLAREWTERLPLSEETIRSYLTENIHYVLDEDCLTGMRQFFAMAANAAILPAYEVNF